MYWIYRLLYLTCDMLSSFCFKSGFLSEFERFWVRRLLFFIIEGQGRNPYFERVPAPERFFPRKSHRFAFKLCSKKVERFTLLLVPSDRKSSKRPGASPGRKWMSTVFHAMRNALFDFYCLASRNPLLNFLFFSGPDHNVSRDTNIWFLG